VADGLVTVELPAALLAGDPEADLSRPLAQIVFTLTALPSIDQVRFGLTGGSPEAAATATVPSEAVDRDDFAYQTPPILVESPTIGAVVSNPVNVRGTANTVEGSFVVRIEQTGDGQDVILAETLVQTSGSGTRGPFDVTLDLPANASGPARLVTYQISRSAAGEAIDRVEIPIDLGPWAIPAVRLEALIPACASNWLGLMTDSFIMSAPVLALFLAPQRHVVRVLTDVAVKY
jgi:hypothetical protein